MISKDKFLTQSTTDISHKLPKQEFGPNQCLEKLLQLAQTVYYGREYEEEKWQQKRTRDKVQALVMTAETVMNQPEEKNSQRNPGEKGWACYYCGKEEHLKWSCSQASKLLPAPCLVCKGPSWGRDCLQRCRPQGSGSHVNQGWRCPEVPTQAPTLLTPWVLITGEGGREINQSVSFWTLGKLSLCSLKPLVHFPPKPLL